MKRALLILTSGLWLLTSGLAPALIDSNSNGLSDLFERQYNSGDLLPATFDPESDDDQDGWTNAEEAVAGTNPFDPNPPVGILRPDLIHTPAVWGDPDNDGNPDIITPEAITISWTTIPGKHYRMLVSTSLAAGSWLLADDPFIGTGNQVNYHFLTGSGYDQFFRVAISDTDTDSDSLTNAEEHALGTNPAVIDTDGDELADAEEVNADSDPLLPDTDGDGISDKLDVLTEPQKIFNWLKEEPILYAAFPTSPPGTILQANDHGFILTSEAIWKNGVSYPLDTSNGVLLRDCKPLSLGDNGFILGIGEIDLPDDDGERLSACLVTWSVPPTGTDLIPQPLVAEGSYVSPVFLDFNDSPAASSQPPSDLLVNRHGQFVAHRSEVKTITSNDDTFKYLSPLSASGIPIFSLFESSSDNPSVSYLFDVAERSVFAASDEDDVVIMRPDRRLLLDGFVFPEHYNRVVRFDDTRLIALTGIDVQSPFSHSNSKHPLVRLNNEWLPGEKMLWATDYASETRTALLKSWWLYHNGWMFKGFEKLPNQRPEWQEPGENCFADITPQGILLQMRQQEETVTTMIGVPLRPKTGGNPIGLDNLSVTARSPIGSTPAMLAGNKKEFWMMVPAGDSLTFDLESGANSQTPLSLASAEGLTFSPALVDARNVALTVTATQNLAGQEHDVGIKVGSVSNATAPLKMKVMKRRNVNLSIYPLRRPSASGTPPSLPSQADIETYIDGIFKKQIATDFAVTVYPASTISNDPGPTFHVDDNPPMQHQIDIASTRQQGNIQIFVLLDYQEMWPSGGLLPVLAWANPDSNFAWVGVECLLNTPPDTEGWLNTCAHELGHILFGAGHPNVETAPGPACLPQSNRSIRLMFSGAFSATQSNIRRWTVKAEWDKADEKLVELLGEGD